jgi:vitamin B12 transporter
MHAADSPGFQNSGPKAETKAPAEDDSPLTRNDEGVYQTLLLAPVGVTAGRYKPIQSTSGKLKIEMFFDMKFDFGWPPIGGGPFVITPAHVPQKRGNVAAAVAVIDRSDLLDPASASVAGTLLSLPEFNRLNGRAGVSENGKDWAALRGVGADCSGALVLLDGVPLHDAFNGEVLGNALPYDGLARAEVVPNGGATAWGNGASGGIIQFFTMPAKGELVLVQGQPADGGPPDPNLRKQAIRGTAQLSAMAGEYGSRGVDFVISQPTANGVFQLIGRALSSDGALLVAPEDRGSIDECGWSHQHLFEGRWRRPLQKGIELAATIRHYEETRGEGTPYQQSESRGTFASIVVAGKKPGGLAWNGVAYVQTGSSVGNFSIINADRTSEIPFIREVVAPSTAAGASLTGEWRQTGDSRLIAGVDFRTVRGEAKQDFGFDNSSYTHQLAGEGAQRVMGFFLIYEAALFKNLRGTLGSRVDDWNDTDGRLLEVNQFTGSVLRDEHLARSHGMELSPNLGLVWRSRENLRWRLNAQRAYRRPTLGEKYATFGRHSVVTEANSALQTEHNTGVEAGVDYSIGRRPFSAKGKPREDVLPMAVSLVVLSTTVFSNEIHDMIGNVTVGQDLNAFSQSLSLPSGYLVKKRINFDRTRIQGIQLSTDWRPTAAFSLKASVLFNQAEIRQLNSGPGSGSDLAGHEIANVPQRTFILKMQWRPANKISVSALMRAVSGRFADNENTLRLGATATLNLGASYLLTEHTEIYLTAENVRDARVETDRGTTGVVYLGSPRLILIGARVGW